MEMRINLWMIAGMITLGLVWSTLPSLCQFIAFFWHAFLIMVAFMGVSLGLIAFLLWDPLAPHSGRLYRDLSRMLRALDQPERSIKPVRTIADFRVPR